MSKFDEMHAAITEAEDTLSAADNLSTKVARVLVGRLRNVRSGWILSALKKELRGFNMVTKEWNE